MTAALTGIILNSVGDDAAIWAVGLGTRTGSGATIADQSFPESRGG